MASAAEEQCAWEASVKSHTCTQEHAYTHAWGSGSGPQGQTAVPREEKQRIIDGEGEGGAHEEVCGAERERSQSAWRKEKKGGGGEGDMVCVTTWQPKSRPYAHMMACREVGCTRSWCRTWGEVRHSENVFGDGQRAEKAREEGDESRDRDHEQQAQRSQH